MNQLYLYKDYKMIHYFSFQTKVIKIMKKLLKFSVIHDAVLYGQKHNKNILIEKNIPHHDLMKMLLKKFVHANY